MAFTLVVSFCAVLAVANAGGILTPVATYAAAGPVVAKLVQPSFEAVGTTHENVVRSFGGTVSTHSKNVITPYSSVSKVDSRITNNVYAPAVAKTVYAAPAVYTAPVLAKTLTYAAPGVAKSVYTAPALAKTVTYAAPAPIVEKTLFEPVPTVAAYAAHAPAVAQTLYSAPVVAKPLAYAAAPAVYTHAAAAATVPAVYSHAAAPAVIKQAYSPAEVVSHVSFDGFGAHWGY